MMENALLASFTPETLAAMIADITNDEQATEAQIALREQCLKVGEAIIGFSAMVNLVSERL